MIHVLSGCKPDFNNTMLTLGMQGASGYTFSVILNPTAISSGKLASLLDNVGVNQVS